jgi:hypothetical protein
MKKMFGWGDGCDVEMLLQPMASIYAGKIATPCRSLLIVENLISN